MIGMKRKLQKAISKINIFAHLRKKKMRNAIKNMSPSFLCPNCIGGILFHDLGLKFMSPTVNLMMLQEEFAKFILNFDHYKNTPLKFYKDEQYSFPCAVLDDIHIYFTHYHSEEEAREKWEKRMERVDMNNLFVFLEERDHLSYEQIKKLGEINAKGLVIFTAHDYPEFPYCLFLKKYEKNGEVGNILIKSWINESREYEKYFDFVKWFNEAEGKPYNIHSCKKEVL